MNCQYQVAVSFYNNEREALYVRNKIPNVPIIDLHDALLSAIENRLVIDIIALDKRLRNMYPEEWECMSMKEIIIKHYGLEAMQLIESVL